MTKLRHNESGIVGMILFLVVLIIIGVLWFQRINSANQGGTDNDDTTSLTEEAQNSVDAANSAQKSTQSIIDQVQDLAP